MQDMDPDEVGAGGLESAEDDDVSSEATTVSEAPATGAGGAETGAGAELVFMGKPASAAGGTFWRVMVYAALWG